MKKRAASTFLGIDQSVFTVGAVSLIAMAFASTRADKMLAIAGAVIFAARFISAAYRTLPATGALAAIRQSAFYNAIALAWAGMALLIAYPVLGLKWQHGWQYGLGAAVIAVLFFSYAQRLETPSSNLAQAGALEMARLSSAVLALAIAIAAGWLIFSGKLLTLKNDWLANDVFLAVAASMFAVAILTFVRARQS